MAVDIAPETKTAPTRKPATPKAPKPKGLTTAEKESLVPAAEHTPETVEKKPKKPLSWKERLAQLPEDEAKALRAKAAEASRISKAKKRHPGKTVEDVAIERIQAKLAKLAAEQTALNTKRQDLEEQLEQAVAAKVKEASDGAA